MAKYTKAERDKLIKKFKIPMTRYMRECISTDSSIQLHTFYDRLKELQKNYKGIDIKNAIIEIEYSCGVGGDYCSGSFDGMFLQFWQNKSIIRLEEEIDSCKEMHKQRRIDQKENRKKQRDLEKLQWERLNKKFGKSIK